MVGCLLLFHAKILNRFGANLAYNNTWCILFYLDIPAGSKLLRVNLWVAACIIYLQNRSVAFH